jgi:hypothetical protein
MQNNTTNEGNNMRIKCMLRIACASTNVSTHMSQPEDTIKTGCIRHQNHTKSICPFLSKAKYFALGLGALQPNSLFATTSHLATMAKLQNRTIAAKRA